MLETGERKVMYAALRRTSPRPLTCSSEISQFFRRNSWNRPVAERDPGAWLPEAFSDRRLGGTVLALGGNQFRTIKPRTAAAPAGPTDRRYY